jgi:hypothetical protein
VNYHRSVALPPAFLQQYLMEPKYLTGNQAGLLSTALLYCGRFHPYYSRECNALWYYIFNDNTKDSEDFQQMQLAFSEVQVVQQPAAT